MDRTPRRFAASWRGPRRRALALLAGAPLALEASGESRTVRFAMSDTLVSDVNLSDAKAAMLVWTRRISRQMGFESEYSPSLFDPSREILRRVRAGEVDAVALNIFEYQQVRERLDDGLIITQDDGLQSQYVVLVNRASGVETLSGLRGGRLVVLKTPYMCLGPAWLEGVLAAEGRGPAAGFLGPATVETKFSQSVLPVFFGKAEACLTSRRGFETMGEMNPQVRKRLRVVAESPPLVVTFYIFRKGYRGRARDKVVEALLKLRTSPDGRQLMTFFQFDSLVVRDGRCLETALHILEAGSRKEGG